MNIKMLKRLQRIITRRADQFDMNLWFSKNKSVSHCGTVACLAGWSLTLDNTKNKKLASPLKCAIKIWPSFELDDEMYMGSSWNSTIQNKAAEVLKLTSDQSKRLFYAANWPSKFRSDYYYYQACGLSRQTAVKVTCERIDHFINTDGKE